MKLLMVLLVSLGGLGFADRLVWPALFQTPQVFNDRFVLYIFFAVLLHNFQFGV